MAQESSHSEPEEQVPWGQILFDNIFLLFVLGIAIPVLFYLVWGLVDIASTPVLQGR